MRLLICIFLLWFSLGSCRVVKRTHSETKRTDSSRVEQTQQSGQVQGFIETIVRDTILKVEEKILHDTIDLSKLSIGQRSTKIGKNQSSTTTNLGNGKIAVESRCGELEVLLKGQIQLTKYWQTKFNKSKSEGMAKSQSSQVIDTKKTSKIPLPIILLGVAVLLLATGTFIVIKYVK